MHPAAGSVSSYTAVLSKQGFCTLLENFSCRKMFVVDRRGFVCTRSESGSGGVDGGGAPAAGVSAGGPEPLPCFIGQSQQSAHKQMQVAATVRVHRLRHTHAV